MCGCFGRALQSRAVSHELQSRRHFVGLCCSYGTLVDKFDENRQLMIPFGTSGAAKSNKYVEFASP